jgi:hypothetical protein
MQRNGENDIGLKNHTGLMVLSSERKEIIESYLNMFSTQEGKQVFSHLLIVILRLHSIDPYFKPLIKERNSNVNNSLKANLPPEVSSSIYKTVLLIFRMIDHQDFFPKNPLP